MSYKNIFLAILLIPFALFGNGTETQIKELKEARYKKELELSEMGKNILEKYAYIQSVRKEAINIINNVIAKKDFNEQEAKEFGQTIDVELDAFVRVLHSIKDINGFLIKELFKKSESDQIEEDFEAVKFSLVTIINEYRILKTLIQNYEALEQERREINHKLTILHK